MLQEEIVHDLPAGRNRGLTIRKLPNLDDPGSINVVARIDRVRSRGILTRCSRNLLAASLRIAPRVKDTVCIIAANPGVFAIVVARLLRVSRNTVLAAYDDLAADNLAEKN